MSYTLKSSRFIERLKGMPLFKALLPFALGILLAEWYTLPLWFLTATLLLTGVATLLLRRAEPLLLLLMSSGMLLSTLQPRPTQLPPTTRTLLLVQVDLDGVPRTHSLRTEGRLMQWRDPMDGGWHRGEGRLILWADTTLTLQGGEQLLIEGRIYPFRNGSNAYRRLMQRRGYLGSCYLTEEHLLERLPPTHTTLHLWASRTLEGRLATDKAASAVVRAMSIGDRGGIDPALREAYARSGMSHLMALSGLHTGVVFLMINLLLWWLPLFRRGHILRNLLSIALLWLFVAMAGFPPSAVRAAVMCSILQGALASSSPYQAMNAWSAAAFMMLLWNPRWLGDVSFQLSFVAVAAILLWGVPLCRRCRTHYWLPNALIDTLLIGLTASLATAPLVAHAFGRVPLIGVLLNPVVVLLAAFVVGGGLLTLLFSPLARPAAWLATHAAEWLNRIAETVAATPYSTWEVAPSATLVGAIYLLLFGITLFGWCIERKKSVHLYNDDPRSL